MIVARINNMKYFPKWGTFCHREAVFRAPSNHIPVILSIGISVSETVFCGKVRWHEYLHVIGCDWKRFPFGNCYNDVYFMIYKHHKKMKYLKKTKTELLT